MGREFVNMQKKSLLVEKEGEKLIKEKADLEREIQGFKTRYANHDNTIKDMKRREAQLKTQLDEAFKNREELNRLKSLLSDMQRRLDTATKDTEQKDGLLTTLKNEK